MNNGPQKYHDNKKPAKEKKLLGHQAQVTANYVQPARVKPAQGSSIKKHRCTAMIGSHPEPEQVPRAEVPHQGEEREAVGGAHGQSAARPTTLMHCPATQPTLQYTPPCCRTRPATYPTLPALPAKSRTRSPQTILTPWTRTFPRRRRAQQTHYSARPRRAAKTSMIPQPPAATFSSPPTPPPPPPNHVFVGATNWCHHSTLTTLGATT